MPPLLIGLTDARGPGQVVVVRWVFSVTLGTERRRRSQWRIWFNARAFALGLLRTDLRWRWRSDRLFALRPRRQWLWRSVHAHRPTDAIHKTRLRFLPASTGLLRLLPWLWNDQIVHQVLHEELLLQTKRVLKLLVHVIPVVFRRLKSSLRR